MKEEWFFIFISYFGQEDGWIRYRYVIDCTDLNLAGIVEFDKSLVHIDQTDAYALLRQEKSKRIRSIKDMDETVTQNSDLYAMLTVHYVLNYYHMMDRFPYETGFINPLNSDEFFRHREFINELMKRFNNNKSIEKYWKIK